MRDIPSPWAVAEELTREDYKMRVADRAQNVYTDGNRYFQVFEINGGDERPPDGIEGEGRILIMDSEVVIRMAAQFGMKFKGIAEA